MLWKSFLKENMRIGLEAYDEAMEKRIKGQKPGFNYPSCISELRRSASVAATMNSPTSSAPARATINLSPPPSAAPVPPRRLRWPSTSCA